RRPRMARAPGHRPADGTAGRAMGPAAGTSRASTARPTLTACPTPPRPTRTPLQPTNRHSSITTLRPDMIAPRRATRRVTTPPGSLAVSPRRREGVHVGSGDGRRGRRDNGLTATEYAAAGDV